MKKIALYDLSVMPTTFDFAVYLTAARTLGYEEIRFVVGAGMASWKYGADIGWKRWANIALPLCEMVGMPYSVRSGYRSDDEPADVLEYSSGYIARVYHEAGRIERLRSGLKVDIEGYVTITMRESFRNQWRNSDRAAWARVQDWLEQRGEDVVVIEECEAKPRDIAYRLAVYENAKMNLAVGNGPMVLCWLSLAPYITFQLPQRPGFERERAQLEAQWIRLGFPPGSQLPFAHARQFIDWHGDDFDNVVQRYQQVMGAPLPVWPHRPLEDAERAPMDRGSWLARAAQVGDVSRAGL